MYLMNGIPLRPGEFIGPDGTTYASNWLERSTPEQRAELGIVEEPDPLPDPEPPPSIQQLIAYAADKRWRVETGGIVHPTFGFIPTDERTRGVLTAGWSKAKENPSYVINDWKTTVPGVYVTLDAASIIAIGDAVEAHVQACFTANKAVDVAILAVPPTITSFAEIDAADWPSNS